MAKFKLIYDVPRDAPQYLGSAEDVAADDAAINAALPNAVPGTIITTAGYHNMKQKQADGTWARLDYESSPNGWVNPSDATATADDILSGKTAYIADGTKATGTIEEKTSSDITTEDNAVTVPAGYYAEAAEIVVGTAKSAQTYTPTTADQTIAAGQYLSGAQTVKGDANLVAGNIKKDAMIFGVTGTYEGEEPGE